MSDSPHRDPVQQFAYRTPAELENGATPWVCPWDLEKAGGAQAPFNPFTRSQRE
jgi:antirestriction protein ArdC